MRLIAALCLLLAAIALLAVAATRVVPLQAAATILHRDDARTVRLDSDSATDANRDSRPNELTVSPPTPAQPQPQSNRSSVPPADVPWAKLGDRARNVLAIEAKQVPLPAGEWQLVSTAAADHSDAPDHTNTIISAVLLRLRGDRADAAILIQTNKADSSITWGRPTGCDHTDYYSARIRYASDHDGSCAYIAYVDATAKPDVTVDPAWRDTTHKAAAAGIRLPMHWLVAAYRVSDPRDGLEVRYFFAPRDVESAPGTESTARPVPPERIESLRAWSDLVWPVVGSGFRNRLNPEDETPIPTWPAAKTDAADEQADRSTVGGGLKFSRVGIVGMKTITWRIVGTMSDFSVNYLYLGTTAAAGGLAVISAVASSALYFAHELAWSYAITPRHLVTDLPGIGMEQPGPDAG